MLNIKCIKCKLSKQESDFSIFRGQKNKTCKDCRDKNNSWYKQDKGYRKTKAKLYYQKIKSRISQYRSDLRLDRKYSLTRKEWHEMLIKQNGKCPICDIIFGEVKPCVDHNHVTGKIRGLLCRNCNLDLQVVENIKFVEKAESYLSQ